MKKFVIFISVLFFATWWGCEKDQIFDVTVTDTVFKMDSISNNVISNENIIYPNFNENLTYDTITDIDGNVYRTIQIGSQVWMAQNLKTTHYNDGSPIFLGKGDGAGNTDWFDLRSGAYCWYLNDAVYKPMGAVYNWFAIETGKLAPAGWHVPTTDEWDILINFLGGEKAAHDKLIGWSTNESGFSAVPSPLVDGWGLGTELSFWSATSGGGGYASVPYAYYFSLWEENSIPKVSLFSYPQSFGFCVRCLKDNPQ